MSMDLLKRMTIGDLKHALWTESLGMVPVGGLPREWYEDELELRMGSRDGCHEEGEES